MWYSCSSKSPVDNVKACIITNVAALNFLRNYGSGPYTTKSLGWASGLGFLSPEYISFSYFPFEHPLMLDTVDLQKIKDPQ